MSEFKILISKTQIQERVASLALEIERDFPASSQPLVVVGVLTGAFIFAADLIRQMKRPLEVDFVQLSSYGSAEISSGDVQWKKRPSISLEGRDVLILEDIIDTGHTVKALREWANGCGARRFKIAVFLDKPSRRQVPVDADFVGFKIEDHFVLGYGLDLDGLYREIEEIVYKVGV